MEKSEVCEDQNGTRVCFENSEDSWEKFQHEYINSKDVVVIEDDGDWEQ